MIGQPKGLKYWTDDGINPKAPQWAKDEYVEYMQAMDEKPDKNGIVRYV
ncbi:hypothetical protein PT287_07810 [Lactobacillus sp. ESL0679]|nr:hypothetical protein [Lactobacillus sp. ESL0679]MDF7683405.1 hypothetical protein [Lactobacillus sp. ESL0679]